AIPGRHRGRFGPCDHSTPADPGAHHAICMKSNFPAGTYIPQDGKPQLAPFASTERRSSSTPRCGGQVGRQACGAPWTRPRQGHSAGADIIELMSNSSSRRFPVTVTQLPVTRCQICHRTVAYRPGNLSEVLTEHYRRAHPEELGLSFPVADAQTR